MGNLEQAAEKKPLIVLTGPTAVGKTALSIQLARRSISSRNCVFSSVWVKSISLSSA